MRNGRVDANQTKIVKALRAHGVTVFPTSDIGRGFPDLIVNSPYTKRIYFMEVKDGNKPPSQRKLTPAQVKFHSHPAWEKYCCVVKNVDEALLFAGVTDDVAKRARRAGL